MPGLLFEGTGEASLAIEAARGAEPTALRPRFEPGEEAIGTGRGRELEGCPSLEEDMLAILVRTAGGVG